jgi:hypothetical protein
MKKSFRLLLVGVFVLLAFSTVQASLFVRGTDSLGNQLIYDDVRDVTWYDFTFNEYDIYTGPPPSYPLNSWYTVNGWAEDLSVNFGGKIYADWRLPTADVSGYSGGVPAYDGTSPWGYNVTSSEMGSLFYDTLGNQGDYDITGVFIGLGFANDDPFEHLLADMYYSSTVTSGSWSFDFESGYQYPRDTTDGALGIAVLDGDVAPIPEPSTLLLLGSGLAGLIFHRKKRK